ncbi:hypothetical protein KGM_215282 [Danaus plexippus plexippus]|uniref:Uncharacterized protein n=1 Tax=Danaus plexippus plexippus TaxID=278856 RepID=A0A212F142_DANPL|nr:hypothetical protein KGM_215282 [Danaus plexippus plexippus]
MSEISEKQANSVVQLKEWVKGQPHLPQNLDEHLLLRFAHSCYYDMDKAKTTVETFFTVRNSCSDLLTNRDPNSHHMQKIMKVINIGQYELSDNTCLWLWQINDPGLDTYDYTLDAKLFFLTTDAFFMSDKHLYESDIVLMDVKDISLKFITKLNISVARKLAKYQEDAIPIRLKQVHVINAPSFIDKIYGVLKPFMRKEHTEMIHFHSPKSETLFKYIKKEDLPEDYGGLKPSLAELTENSLEKVMNNREQLLDENLWRTKKNGTSVDEGSFRKLAID